MSAYWAILSARFRVLLQYRAAAVAGFGTQLFWGFIRVMIFTAFYESSTASHPMSLPETINYIWLGQAFLLLLPWNMDRETEQLIRTGNVAYEILRPLDLYWFWYARAVALRLAPVILRAVPMFIIASLFLGLEPPPSWSAALAFGISTLGALFLSSALTTLSSISLFWTISGEGIARFFPSAAILFSGLVLPLPLFPEWLQPVLNFLPFRGILDVPFRFYMGHIPAAQLLGLFGHQVLWTIFLIMAGRFFLARGLRRIVVQGG